MTRLSLKTETTTNDLVVNNGTADNANNGDKLRNAFGKLIKSIDRAEANFIELYAHTATDATDRLVNGNKELVLNVDGDRAWVDFPAAFGDSISVQGAEIGTNPNIDESPVPLTLSSFDGDVNIRANSTGPVSTWSFGTDGSLTFPDDLKIADSVIGHTSTDSVNGEGTTETTDIVSNIDIDLTRILITKSTAVTVDDGVITSTDSIGSKLTLTDSSIAMEGYSNPEGPNNIAYSRVTAGSGAVILKSATETVGGETSTIVTVGSGLSIVSTDGVTTGSFDVDTAGIVTLSNNSYLEPTGTNLAVGSQGVVTIRSNAASNLTDREWEFDKSGTLKTPLMLPLTFYPVLDSEHMTRGVGLTDAPWEFQVEFQVNPNGTVQTAINNPTWPSNPGYIAGDEFVYVEADHGIPGYTFSLILTDIIEGEGWTANLAVAEPPEYPSTVATLGAIKLTANDQSFVFGTDGHLVLPDGARIKSTGSLYGQLEIELDGIEATNWRFTTDQGPGILEYPDGAFTTGSQTFSAIDHDLVLGVRHRPTVSAECYIANGSEFVADIEFVDDIIVVQVGWTVSVGGTPYTVISIDPAPPANQYRITVDGATFVQGTTYTFTDPDSVTQEWAFNNTTGTLRAPGGALLSSETAVVGEGDVYRDFSIELLNLTGTNEYRWTFDNTAGALTIPGGIAASADMTFTAGSNSITLDTAGQLVTEHAIKWQEGGQERAGISYNPFTDGFVIGTNTSGITKAWKFGDNGNLTLPAGGDIVDSNGDSVLGIVGGGTGALELQTVPTTKFGTTGDTKGMVAIDSATGDFYYCIANYTDGLTSIWRKTTGSDAW